MLDIFYRLKSCISHWFNNNHQAQPEQAHDLGHGSKCVWELDKEA